MIFHHAMNHVRLTMERVTKQSVDTRSGWMTV